MENENQADWTPNIRPLQLEHNFRIPFKKRNVSFDSINFVW